MRSSYRENNYGEIFKALVKVHRPKLIVECGVLDGYSLYCMASATDCPVVGIDLFEDYEYKNAKMEDVWNRVSRLKNIILLRYDAFKAADLFADESIDILHMDLSNTGDMVKEFAARWRYKLREKGLFLFEGGSQKRDRVGWMEKYQKKAISPVRTDLERMGYEHVTLEPYPSLTICKRTKK